VLCQVTSNAYGDPTALPIGAADFADGGLRVASFARPGKLFTASSALIVRSVGTLAPASFGRILAAVASLFQPPSSDA
jgi:hypothetical protein